MPRAKSVDSTGSPQVKSGFDKLSGGGFDPFDKLKAGRLTTKGCTLYIHKDFHNSVFEQTLLADRGELQERYCPMPVRSSKFTDVYRFGVEFGNVKRVVYLKEYFYRSWWDFVKHFFRSSRAKRAMEAGFMLAENGFESPYVIAMGHRNFAFLTTRSFVVTLEVENALSVYQIITDKRDNPKAEQLRERRSFVRAFGRTIGRMHADGIFHGDLRLGNVLAREEQDGWHIFFLDNERTKRFRRLPARLRLKNLVQINMFEPGAVNNTDRMRFFKEYWAENKESGFEKAALIKKVLKKTGRRLRKK